jgi:hypothetical protein
MEEGVHELLEQVAAAVRRTPTGSTADPSAGATECPAGGDAARDDAAGSSAAETLDALAALHELHARLQTWEPRLIEAAREQGVAWGRLAPALGVTSRQAAERRYLRLRPTSEAGLTREERVQATRDRRAGDRAVAAWARDNAPALRQIAGQVSGVAGLSSAGRRRAKVLVSSMAGDDPAALLAPLADMHRDLIEDHAVLAARVDEVGRRVHGVRRETQHRRDEATQA